MALLGPADMKQYAIPSGWDAGELKKIELADGTNLDEVYNLISAGLSVTNGELFSDPLYGTMLAETDEVALEYRNGVVNGMQERSEYTKADSRRDATIGHMIPLKSFDRKLGWTWDFLRKARMKQIESDIAGAIYDVKDNFQRLSLTRFFSTAYNTIATAGIDAPLVDGTTASLSYQPPSYAGKTFATSHSHFDRRTDDATGRAAALNAGARHLYEHGITPPYIAVIPEADIADFAALTGWFKRDYGIQYIRTDSGANFGVMSMSEQFVGGFESEVGLVYVWASPRIPTNYLGMYKSYGINDPRNSVLIRGDKQYGAGAVLLPAQALMQHPLQEAYILHEFGPGISEGRLNGYCCYFASSGDYTVPTIS